MVGGGVGEAHRFVDVFSSSSKPPQPSADRHTLPPPRASASEPRRPPAAAEMREAHGNPPVSICVREARIALQEAVGLRITVKQ